MTCRWIDCDQPPHAHGICAKHYDQTLRAGRRMIRRSQR